MAYHFELPLITELTIPQQVVLNEVRAVSISGGPGTGKSIVSLWRHLQNYDLERRKSLLLTYNKSLKAYFSLALKSPSLNVKAITKEKTSEATNTTYLWISHGLSSEFDEIIIDEAQDLDIENYELIKKYTKMVSYGIDRNQSMYLSSQKLQELVDGLPALFTDNIIIPPLNENFRNTYQITHFVRSLFPNRIFPNGQTDGEKPILVCTDNDQSVQIKVIFDIINRFHSDSHNIAILVPLVNPALHRQKVVRDYYNILNENGFKCSFYENDNGELLKMENIHITTFKSAKGLEFDTVIIPDFQYFEEDIKRLNVVNDNDYYVTLTRAKRNLILIDNSKTNMNNRCSLLFLQSQITNNILSVDYDYVKKATIEEPDDLPF
ncbi:3'-5' exonuclease [Kordia sp.]|uniref:3'-5' exonuclease n=1 Tax=Kordia sp. TaxID=1965332 RepID=UPI003D2C068A